MSSALDDCLRLLRGASDEQRLAGLLLATKFCQGDDKESVLKVYDAVGPLFLNRLLKTGLVKGDASANSSEDREAYLRLSVTILAAFCRFPEIASSEDMVSKLPIILEVISNISDPFISEECYEILLLVGTATEEGLIRLYESGVLRVLSSRISVLPDGSRSVELAIRLLQIILSKLPLDTTMQKHQSEMSCLVMAIGKQFGLLHSSLKFDALHLLTTILSSEASEAMHDLKSTSNIWATYVRVGIVAVLQNRVASTEKHHALALAASMMSLVGEKWLLDHNSLPGDPNPMPIDKCLLLVLESARVEVAVLLNELAYLKFEVSKSSSKADERVTLKQQSIALLFSLIEKIIKLICEEEGNPIYETPITKAINGLNETIDLVLDFLNDAKDHKQMKGDDLLASVRLLGSYLAEAPFACKEKVQNLLEYILSIEGQDEPRPFYAVCFMLPYLCQTAMDVEGCKALISCGGHKSVFECLLKMIGPESKIVEDHGTALLACDIIKNLLLNMEKVQVQVDVSDLVPLLGALALWTEKNIDMSIIMIASCICTLVFNLTSEHDLLKMANFDRGTLQRLSQLIARSLDPSRQVQATADNPENHDLYQIISTDCHCWIDRFPTVMEAIKRQDA